ncbi:MAG: hypothetical protein O3A51_05170 [Verrucomicrobia bacterium]|nr:hypothetical protein [Verrucomicrobiota bacterium]
MTDNPSTPPPVPEETNLKPPVTPKSGYQSKPLIASLMRRVGGVHRPAPAAPPSPPDVAAESAPLAPPATTPTVPPEPQLSTPPSATVAQQPPARDTTAERKREVQSLLHRERSPAEQKRSLWKRAAPLPEVGPSQRRLVRDAARDLGLE